MRARILGPVEIDVDGRVLVLGRSRQQRLLAVLLVDAGRTVPLDTIVTALWDGEPPRTARKLVQNSASELRRMLSDAGGPTDCLVTDAVGYGFRVGEGQLDLGSFEEHLAAARRRAAAGDLAAAVDEFRAGLALWRGPALAGVPGRVIAGQAARLEELRLAALEECFDHELTLGRHHRMTGELASVLAEQPLRERLAGQLMLALFRSGRRPDALGEFHKLRQRLADELGLDPDAETCRLHEAILRADPALDLPPPESNAQKIIERVRPTGDRVVPAQLPADIGVFAGRRGELSRLDGLLTAADGMRALAVTAVVGMAGVGKSTLALHWAHRVAAGFPDGQLYVNLRGFDPSGVPMPTAEALRGFLDALGVNPQRIPADLAAQSALYRTLLAGRRVLVVLDNARDADHLRPLLPGAPGCLVVITSRTRLTGLVVAGGAQLVALEPLSATEARELLVRRLGSQRVTSEPRATEEIIDRCARLPLALSIVAARAVTEPSFPLGTLVEELRMTDSGLDAFSGEDVATDARAVFSWSYGALGPAAARLFRLLGLTSVPDIAVPAAASLAGLAEPATRGLLAELTRAHLVTQTRPGRYTMHDLLRAYAAELAPITDGVTERRSAQHRLLDHYLASAHAAAHVLDPDRDAITLPEFEPGVRIIAITDTSEALRWFSAEEPSLLAAVPAAAEAGFDGHAWRIGWTLAVFLFRRGAWAELTAVNESALVAARRLDDPVAMAHTYRGLGVAATQSGRFAEADTHYRQALGLFRRAGHHSGQGRVHLNLGALAERLGRPTEEALAHGELSRDLYRLAGNRTGEAMALNSIGWWLAMLGEPGRGLEHCERSLALHQQFGGPTGEANAWDSLGYVNRLLDRYPQSVESFQHAIAQFRQTGDRYNEACSLTRLGDAHHAFGHEAAARQEWRQALHIFDDLDDPKAAAVRDRLEKPR